MLPENLKAEKKLDIETPLILEIQFYAGVVCQSDFDVIRFPKNVASFDNLLFHRLL